MTLSTKERGTGSKWDDWQRWPTNLDIADGPWGSPATAVQNPAQNEPSAVKATDARSRLAIMAAAGHVRGGGGNGATLRIRESDL